MKTWMTVLCGLVVNVHVACTAAESSNGEATEAGVGTDTPTTGTLRLESLGRVVAVTDPVIPFASTDTSASATAAANFNSLIINGLKLATKGVSLGDPTTTINSAFNAASGSKAFCETVNNGMKFFREAGQSDVNLCILRKAPATLTVKDGYQVWDFTGMSTFGQFTYRMKVYLQLDDDGGLKKFESFTCKNSKSAGMKQSGYTLQTITDGKLEILARMTGDGGGETVYIRTEVSGEVNADGRQIGLKTIDYAEKSASGRSVHTKVTQSDGNIQTIGYESSMGRLTQYLNFVELLDSNAATGQYYVTKLAYGDGAAITRVTEGSSSTNNTASWDGDTLVLDSSEVRRDKVLNRESDFITSTGDNLDLDFAVNETFDCSGTADETITISVMDMMGCSKPYDIDQNGSTMCNSLSY
jgi:hypothetical protein